MSWTKKHLLDIESLTAEEITTVLDTARGFKAVGERAIKKVPALRGKTVVNLFVEPSTRTRISFELAAQRLSADIVNFSAEASSFKKGETLKDTALNLEALNADFIIIRHSASGAPHFLSRVLDAHVINAGDGAHEHPTQALLDTFTIREKKGKIAGLNVTILGDILYSRVARSDIWALTKLGANVTQVEAYRTAASSLDLNECRDWIGRSEIGAVTFASPSAVIELERALGKDDFGKLLADAAAVAIGPMTARVLTELGCTPVMAESATLRGLANTAFKLVQTRH